jgi:hypothetical protein
MTTPNNTPEPLLRWFESGHLRIDLQPLVESFKGLAVLIVATNSPSAERTVALRKLLESKDAAVRAAILTKGGV